MFQFLLDPNRRQINNLKPLVEKINLLEPEIAAMSAEDFKQKTLFWKDKLRSLPSGEKSDYLNKILPEAFALVREASKRALNKRHYDVQMMAGIVLHQGKIAEQKTGEGKTLTATLPLYLNCLTGEGAHLVTPNDYLARHGTGWMGPVYDYLGISVGVIMQERAFKFDPDFVSSEFEDEYSKRLKQVNRHDAYACDITYGTNHEFGFDYLRDNMTYSLQDISQTNPNGEFGAHTFAIVDEVDFILIDVARTPLIISEPGAVATNRYHVAHSIVKGLLKGTDYTLDEKFRQVALTDLGIRRVEKNLGITNLYEQDFEMVHLIEQSLAANTLYEKDRDYVVKDGAIVIVDQFTGRLLPSNRFSQGLHQSIEAKENVAIQQESQTRAEISYQNYFRMYKKLAGMTGTAVTEAEEFYKIYKLDVVVIPTHQKNVRKDLHDIVYKTESGKFAAVAEEIAGRHALGQPVLVGTTSVEKSQLLHELLKRKKIPHEILNAKNHEKEALIIAQAGRKGAVTVSTNMAGRGVDILLGGDPVDLAEQSDVLAAGGLFVIGTERHDSRRIDNQLRGRSGRQGDAGSSRFFLSLQDDLMRIFGGAGVESLMGKFGLDDTTPIESGLVSHAIENAQKKVEGFNFDRRKYVVEMDDVINVHRDVVYKLRRRILESGSGVANYNEWFAKKFDQYTDITSEVWDDLVQKFGEREWLNIFAQISLPVLDLLWMEHLVDMDQLKEATQLRGYAQKDPKIEYKNEGHARFEALITTIYKDTAERIQKLMATSDFQKLGISGVEGAKKRNLQYSSSEIETGVTDEYLDLKHQQQAGSQSVYKVEEVKSGAPKVGRNDPCPCGSGKKFKSCHGR